MPFYYSEINNSKFKNILYYSPQSICNQKDIPQGVGGSRTFERLIVKGQKNVCKLTVNGTK